MGDRSHIQWTDATWNPVRGCSKVSQGCANCYAMSAAHRMSGPGRAYEGLTRLNGADEAQWTGEVRCIEEKLKQPLRWKKPRRIFVNSMSDLFHPLVPFTFVDKVFAVMALSPRHTFQILTKRPARMKRYLDGLTDSGVVDRLGDAIAEMGLGDEAGPFMANWVNGWSRPKNVPEDGNPCNGTVRRWPLPNVWLGVSAENQETAIERIPLLMETAAAVKWVSLEPLLRMVDVRVLDVRRTGPGTARPDDNYSWSRHRPLDGFIGTVDHHLNVKGSIKPSHRISWIVVGGESGDASRAMSLSWLRQIIQDCRAAKVPLFVKQLGEFQARQMELASKKGGDPEEWPEEFRVREFPNVAERSEAAV